VGDEERVSEQRAICAPFDMNAQPPPCRALSYPLLTGSQRDGGQGESLVRHYTLYTLKRLSLSFSHGSKLKAPNTCGTR
jgi:hypothetical protein